MTNLDDFHSYLRYAGLDTKPHQIEGVKWCLSNELDGHAICSDGGVVRGGLIADEMGLGKTIQMIGVMLCNFKRHTLIVVPRALLEQWSSVFRTTTGHIALVYHGAEKKGVTLSKLKVAPVVITTYGMVSTRKSGLSLLHKMKWDRVVFDEAHHIRNSKTKTHCGSLKLRANVRWLITGTPIQNTKKDLYSLCAAIGIPNRFYLDPSNHEAMVQKFILKRSKNGIGLKLPPLRTMTTKVEWSDDLERRFAADIHSLLSFNGGNGGGNGFNAVANVMSGGYPLVTLLRARQMCVYPPMLRGKLKEMVIRGDIEDETSLSDVICSSSKIDSVVQKVLERKGNGRSKLIFCHYRGEIDVIKSRLVSGGLHVETFDGRTLESERNMIITNKCDVLILQIQTGCEGLNLQHFSEVYFVSPHWNPAVEDQAVARCHRIGQYNPVDVFRFQMAGFRTIDEHKDDDDEHKDDDDAITIDVYAKEVQESKRTLREILEKDERGREDEGKTTSRAELDVLNY